MFVTASPHRARNRAAALAASGLLALGAAFAVMTPALAAPVTQPTIELEAAVIPPAGRLAFATEGWLPDESVTVYVTGPAEYEEDVIPDESGVFALEIDYQLQDDAGNLVGDADFPAGEYTLTLTQDQPDETATPTETGTPTPTPTESETPPPSEESPSTDSPSATGTPEAAAAAASSGGESRELVSASTTFTVGGATMPTATTGATTSPTLAATGATRFAGIAGGAAVLLALGTAVLMVSRLRRHGH